MPKVWSMMDVGRRAMMNSQASLQTTAHNIANKSTEGYSRQRVETVTNFPLGEGKTQIGMGARTGAVNRVNNPFIEKQIEREGSQGGYLNSRAEMLSRVEEVYNEQVNQGLNQSIGSFFNSFRELSNNPESLAARTQVRETADNLTKDFHRVNNQLEAVQKDADFRVATRVNEVNEITREIASLNERIAGVEITGATANDERDRRDLLIKQLGEKINIRYAEGQGGMLTITAGNTAILVSGTSQRDLEVQASPGREGKGEGKLDVFYRASDNSGYVNITQQITGGEIGGLINVRDAVCTELKDSMDNLAYTLAFEVNRAHAQGYDRNGRTGNLFFNMPEDKLAYAKKISLSDAVMGDVGRIATAAEANSAGDNSIANIISSLQYKGVFKDGNATIDQFYNSVVGKVGVQTQRANSEAEAQKDVVKQLKNVRESISGVSLDEETTKMIEFQKVFDASARLIRTADEMLDTVLNIKR